ncbi:MAG: hypothetical protein J3K34DRAFT_462197 [Monoraphidium minutum]|nr:MAG: hypothetical protein J3K34DRAFT_462197 [Monoraphidium minutum]
MAHGSHNEELELSILEASPGVIAIIMIFFLVFTLGLEHALRAARAALRRRRKAGLLAALGHLSSELMLLGVASLVLTALQPQLEVICYPARHAMAPWLSHVDGCACCLTRTRGVSKCFLESRQCPADFASRCAEATVSEHQEMRVVITNDGPASAPGAAAARAAPHATAPPHATPPPPSRALRAAPAHAGAGAGAAPLSPPPTPAASASELEALAGNASRPELLQMAAAAKDAAASAEAELGLCASGLPAVWPECGNRPGYLPIVTATTLEEIHMFLFFVALTHILLGVVTILLSTTKLTFWARRTRPEARDECLELVRAAALAPEPAAGAGAAGPDVIDGAAGGGGGAVEMQRRRAGGEGGEAGARLGSVDIEEGVGAPHGGSGAGGGGGSSPQKAPAAARGRAARGAAALGAACLGTHAPSVGSGSLSDEEGGDEGEGGAVASGAGCGAAAGARGPLAVQCFGPSEWRGRPEKLEGTLAYAREGAMLAWCQLSPLNVSTREYRLLRASFYLRHGLLGGPKAPPETFFRYLLECNQRDGARVVGVGLGTWIFIICFVLLTSAIGFQGWLFSAAAAGLLLLTNTYLVALLRHATRGGAARRPGACGAAGAGARPWALRRGLLLPLIKLLLFCLSFVISNSVFMAIFFGPKSCFFSRTGFQSHPVNWWWVLLFDGGMICSLSLVTLPLYSLLEHTERLDRAAYRLGRTDTGGGAAGGGGGGSGGGGGGDDGAGGERDGAGGGAHGAGGAHGGK